MKAKELIEALAAFPPDASVYVLGEGNLSDVLIGITAADIAKSDYFGDAVILVQEDLSDFTESKDVWFSESFVAKLAHLVLSHGLGGKQ